MCPCISSNILTTLLWLVIVLRSVIGQQIAVNKTNIEATYNRNISITFFVTSTNPIINIEFSWEEITIATYQSSFKIVEPNYFKDRLSFSSEKSRNFKLHIRNTQYTDAGTFRFKVLLKIPDPHSATAGTVIQVKGGPDICGKQLPLQISFRNTSSRIISTNVCGNPPPQMFWSMDGMKLQGTRKEKDPSRKKFEYSVNLTGFDLCDKELSYKIVGALSENMLVGSIKLTDADNHLTCSKKASFLYYYIGGAATAVVILLFLVVCLVVLKRRRGNIRNTKKKNTAGSNNTRLSEEENEEEENEGNVETSSAYEVSIEDLDRRGNYQSLILSDDTRPGYADLDVHNDPMCIVPLNSKRRGSAETLRITPRGIVKIRDKT